MANQGRRGAPVAQIPTSYRQHELRACRRCRLVKTFNQFEESGCENCPFFQMQDDHERVVDSTTSNFTGLISVMDPSRSWASRWLRTGKFAPGCYTLAVFEELPQDLQSLSELSMKLFVVAYELASQAWALQYLTRQLMSKFANICEEERVPYAAPRGI